MTSIFDNEFIPAEKSDAMYSYKKERGYFPGVITSGQLIIGIENRQGNSNVKFEQVKSRTKSTSMLHGKLSHGCRIKAQQEISVGSVDTQCGCLRIMVRYLHYELFSAFIFQSVAVVVMVFAVVVVILSLFVPRPYCRFVCPTGNLFKFAQNTK